MSWLTALHKQTATYWACTGVDSAGDRQFAAPTTLTVKWEDRSDIVIDQDGEEGRSRAVVYLGTDVGVEGYLFLGSSVAADPRTVTGAYLIKEFRKVPTADANDFERRAVL